MSKVTLNYWITYYALLSAPIHASAYSAFICLLSEIIQTMKPTKPLLCFSEQPYTVAAIMDDPSIWFLFNCMFHVYTIQFFAKKKIKNITTCMIIYYCFTVLIYGRKLRRPIQNVVLQKTSSIPENTSKSWNHNRWQNRSTNNCC